MTPQDCEHITEWNVEGWRSYNTMDISEEYLKEDWNRTLMTKINMLSAQINKCSYRGGGDTIKLHPSNRKYLIPNISLIENRYEIIWDYSINPNHIFVQLLKNTTNHGGVYLIPDVIQPIESNNFMSEINFKLYYIDNPTHNEIIEDYKRKTSGCIILTNNTKLGGIKYVEKFKL